MLVTPLVLVTSDVVDSTRVVVPGRHTLNSNLFDQMSSFIVQFICVTVMIIYIVYVIQLKKVCGAYTHNGRIINIRLSNKR